MPNPNWFLFHPLLECFNFRGVCTTCATCVAQFCNACALQIAVRRPASGSMVACTYPENFAACRGALKLLKPSHPLNGVTCICLFMPCASRHTTRELSSHFFLAEKGGTFLPEGKKCVSISCSLRTREIRICSSAFMEIQRLLRTCVSWFCRIPLHFRATEAKPRFPKEGNAMYILRRSAKCIRYRTEVRYPQIP